MAEWERPSKEEAERIKWREPTPEEAQEIIRQFVPAGHLQIAERLRYLADSAPNDEMKRFMRWAADELPLQYMAAKSCKSFIPGQAWLMAYGLGSFLTALKKDVWPVHGDLKAMLIDALGDLGFAMERLVREFYEECNCDINVRRALPVGAAEEATGFQVE